MRRFRLAVEGDDQAKPGPSRTHSPERGTACGGRVMQGLQGKLMGRRGWSVETVVAASVGGKGQGPEGREYRYHKVASG